MKKDKKPDQYNPVNERMQYKYRQHLRRIGQKDDKTVVAALKNIRDFEFEHNTLLDFGAGSGIMAAVIKAIFPD